MDLKIHYDLIGTVPAVECFRNSLDELILRYEREKPASNSVIELGLMSETDIKLYIQDSIKDPQRRQRMCDGLAIELCAQHFYGLKSEDFNSMADLIDAINSMDDDGRVK